MKRIVVTGTPGSGKSTLARVLAQRLGLPCYEPDDWQVCPEKLFAYRLQAILNTRQWVIDGLYRKDISWARADTLIWLDYPLPVVLWRLIGRTCRRVRTGELLRGTSSRETWRRSLFSRKTLIWWVLATHYRRRRGYRRKLRKRAFAHLAVIRLRSPGQTALVLRTFPDLGELGLDFCHRECSKPEQYLVSSNIRHICPLFGHDFFKSM